MELQDSSAGSLRWLIQRNTYHDSVKLMRLSETLSGLPGVEKAAAVMATPLNVELLADDGLLPAGIQTDPDDLLVSVLGRDEEAAEAALAQLDELLAPAHAAGAGAGRGAGAGTAEAGPYRFGNVPRMLEQAAGADLAVIAVPGPLAVAEAFAALRAGMHVFLFSDNVSLEDEIRLKKKAAELDLLMMGPDCGTAILDSVGLGFANRVLDGSVGIVGASGTGIQQVCSLLTEQDIGIAQAIGTGGRDLSAEVGGLMTRRALRMLDADPRVGEIVVISKALDAGIAKQLHGELVLLSKPVVACLFGFNGRDEGSVQYARNLTHAAQMVGAMYQAEVARNPFEESEGKGRPSFRSYIYGLFAGGTLRDEAAQVLDGLGAPHRLVDLGADEYTRGRPHPIIDPRLRASMVIDVGRHDDAGALLLDVILGDLAHPDPAGALLQALEKLKKLRATAEIPVFASVIGTTLDPQELRPQEFRLRKAGVHVFESNVYAAEAAARAVGAAE